MGMCYKLHRCPTQTLWRVGPERQLLYRGWGDVLGKAQQQLQQVATLVTPAEESMYSSMSGYPAKASDDQAIQWPDLVHQLDALRSSSQGQNVNLLIAATAAKQSVLSMVHKAAAALRQVAEESTGSDIVFAQPSAEHLKMLQQVKSRGTVYGAGNDRVSAVGHMSDAEEDMNQPESQVHDIASAFAELAWQHSPGTQRAGACQVSW